MIRNDAGVLMSLVIEKLDPYLVSVSRGYYMVGSFASGEADEMSDVDLAVIWKAIQGSPIDIQGLFNAMHLVDYLSDGRLDLLVAELSEFQQPFRRWQVPGLASASVLASGTDLVRELVLPPLDVHATDLAFRADKLIHKVHGGHVLGGPLSYPDPNREFYGYETKRTWYPDGVLCGTREVVDLTLACAAPFAAKLSGQLVTGKAHCARLYSGVSDPPFSEFVPTLYERCKRDWHYRIPEPQGDRVELRHYCETVLALENHVLAEFSGS